MNSKKFMLISLFLLLILTLGAVSAASDSDDMVSYDLSDDQIIQSNDIDEELNLQPSADDTISTDNSDENENIGAEVIEEDIVDTSSSENSDATLSNAADDETLGATKSYNDLYYLIYPNSGATPSTITLNDDYKYNGDNMIWHGGINIKRSITIYGNGHTIDGNGRFGFFTLTEHASLTIYDLNLVNGLEATDDTVADRGGILVSSPTQLTAVNSNFTNCRARSGAAIYADKSCNVTLTNCIFTANTATDTTSGGGAALYGAPNRLTITNCKFTNNYAPSIGGAVVVVDSTVTIKGTTFSGNSIAADGLGGAIYIDGCPTVTIENSKFDANKAVQSDGGGGAFYASSVNTLTVTSSNFTNNVGFVAGAIAAFNVSNFNVRDSAFRNNNASEEGGAIWMFNSTASMANTDFMANIVSSGRGGAIYSGGDRTLTVSNSRFTNNKVNSGNGGAIYKSSSSLSVTDSSFTGNMASKGASVYIYGVSSGTVTRSNFTDGVASDSGGAIYSDSSTLTVTNSNLNNNRATSHGGAIYQLGGTAMTISDSKFNSNSAGSDKSGGAIYISSTSSINIRNSNFTNNNAKFGGAIYGTGESTLTINGSTFSNNNAELGGAIYYSGRNLKVNASTFTNNKATNTGGAFYMVYGTLTLGNSTVSNNNATAGGGAILGMNSAKINLFNVTLNSNKAYNGSAIYLYENSSILTVSKSTFNNNAADNTGTIYAVPTSTVSITDSSFNSNNVGTYGGAIYVSGSALNVSNSNFTSNKATGGGAIAIDSSATLNLVNSKLDNNIANNSENGYGGAVYSRGSTLNVKGSTFNSNKAQSYGGAVYAESSSGVTVNGSSFSNNAALVSGGALLTSGTPLTVVDSTFSNNNANQVGGAIYSLSNLNVRGSTFSGNKAINGSAIYLGQAISFTIENSVLTQNAASAYGGAIFAHHRATGSVVNTNITYNNASAYGGAMFVHQFANITFNNAILSNNRAQAGGAVFIYPTSNVTIINSALRNNYASAAGAIYAFDQGDYKAILNARGTAFYNNTASQNGGICANNGELYNCTLANTTVEGSITLTNCKVLKTSVFSIGNIADTVYNGAVTISVTESNGYSGTVTVTIGTKSVSVTLTNGAGSASVNLNIAPGVYKAVLNFPGTELFSPSYAESNQFSVRYQTAFTIANIQNAIQGNSITLNVTEANGYSGDVTVKVGTKSYTVTLNNGRGTKTVNDLAVGTYKAIIDFQQTDAYTSAHAESNQFTILYRTAFTIASISNNTVGYPITISVSEANGYSGDVTVKVGTNSYTVSLSNGQGSKSVSDLPVGTYKATISFPGTNAYSSANAESNQFTIKPVSFIDLANIINNAAAGSTITLDKDYEFISDYDSSLVNGILINKNLKINGNGHTIDMKCMGRVFDVAPGVSLTLENFNFINGQLDNGSVIKTGLDSLLTVVNSNFTGNGELSLNGGAIYSEGSTLKISGSNISNNNASRGAGIYAINSALDVSDSEFTKNYCFNGGAFYLVDSTLNVVRTNITGNSEINGDCAIYASASTVNIRDCDISENRGGSNPGVISALDNSKVTISNSTFYNNSAGYSVGVAYLENSSLDVNNSTFIGNGGKTGVISGSGSNLTVFNSIFNDNSASNVGVFSFGYNSSVVIANSSFNNNSGAYIAGVINLVESNDTSLSLINCSISNCSSGYGTGAITASSNNLTISGCTFNNNTGSWSGVSISADNGKIVDSNFTESAISGGISVSDDCNVYYTPSFSFVNNIQDCLNGAPIYVEISEKHKFSGTVTIKVANASFEVVLVNGIGSANVSLDVPFGTYKAILDFTGNENYGPCYIESNEFIIRCSFIDLYNMINSADAGSVITLEHDYSFCDLFDSEFVNGIPITKNIVIDGNGHTIDAKGLARIFNISSGVVVTIENINLTNGNASDGGAIYASSGSDVTVINSIFDNNVAIGTGGAIYSVGVLNVNGSTFENNVAESGSGVFANDGIISGSTFVGGNDASGTISISDDCKFLTSPSFEIGAIPNIKFGSSITITISESHGLNGTVTVTIGTESYDIELANGVGSKTVTPNLVPGTYKAILSFNESGNFYSASAESNEFAININPTTISASAVTATYGVSKNLVATLKDSNGKALSGVKVTIKLSNGKTYTKTTDKNGQVKLSVSGLVPKTYTATITFAGNAYYAKSSKSVKVTVKKATPKMTAKAKTFKVKVKTKKYAITLKTNKGKVMKNTKVTLKVNKKTFTAKTNSKGIATFKITNLKKKGTFKSVIKYAGSKYYNKVTKNVKITVKK